MALTYHEYGDQAAPLLVFIHGGGVSDWMWAQQVQYFEQYHCLVPVLPEHGLQTDGTHFSIKESARTLAVLLAAKGQGKEINVIGFSLGAQVLLELLSQQPALIDRALINSALTRPVPLIKKWLKPILWPFYPLIKYRGFAKLQAKSLFIHETDFERYYAESKQLSLSSLVRVLEENMSFQLPSGFKKAQGKLLVTVGQKEKKMMKQSAREIVAANDNCLGVILADVGHGVSLAKPQYFNRLVENWLLEAPLPEMVEVIRP